MDSGGSVKKHLSFTGPSLGIEPEIDFKIQQAHLDPADLLLGYTDDVTEANNADGAFFTKERLLSILEIPASSVTDLLDRIANSLRDHIGEADQYVGRWRS